MYERDEMLKKAVAQQGLCQATTSAPKAWVELSIEEKLERLREQTKIAQRVAGGISQVSGEVSALRHDFAQHHHAGDKVTIPVDRRQYEGYGAGKCDTASGRDPDPAKVYF